MIAPLEDVPDESMLAVEILRVIAIQVAHATRELALSGLYDKVVVIAHLAIGMHDKVEPFAGLAEQRQPGQAVTVGAEDGAAPVTACGNVVEGVVMLDS